MLNYQRVYVLLIGNGFYKQGLKCCKALRLNMHVRARPLFAVFVASLSCSFRRIAFWTKSVEVLWRTHRAKTSAWIWMRVVAINLLSYLEFPQGSMHSLRSFCVAKEAWIRWQLSCYHVGFGSCDWVSCSKITASAWNQLITGGPHIVDISILSYMVNPMKSH
jgi:hypothetical protein